MSLQIVPVGLKEANAFVKVHHRHMARARGCKFCVGVAEDGKLVGVAICGRPVARHMDDGYTLEVNRLATDGTRNACSMLYSATAKEAKRRGFERVITYTLETEPATTLRAAGWVATAKTKGGSWNTPARARTDKTSTCKKQRWERGLNKRVRKELAA